MASGQAGSPEALVEDYLAAFPGSDRGAAIEELQKVLKRQLVSMSLECAEIGCPKCGSTGFVRNGHTRKGTQRYRCCRCGRTFCACDTGSILRFTKLPFETWMDFAQCFVDGISCAKTADRLGVTPRTAWFMRIRTLQALFGNIPSFECKAGCGATLDETYFPESFKGVSLKDYGGDLPREPHLEKGGTGVRGISGEQICVVTGVNDLNDMFFDVACRGALSNDIARDVLTDRICEGAVIDTDGHKAYPKVLKELGVAHNRHYSEDHDSMEPIDKLHSAIKSFIYGRFRGVSTKWLSHYLAYFKWLHEFGKSFRKVRDLAVKQISSGDYATRWRDIAHVPLPFRDPSLNATKVRSDPPALLSIPVRLCFSAGGTAFRGHRRCPHAPCGAVRSGPVSHGTVPEPRPDPIRNRAGCDTGS